MRGRRDVRNTVFIPNPEPPVPDDEPSVTSSPGPPIAPEAGETGHAGGGISRLEAASSPDPTTVSPIKAPAVLPEERTMSDTTSVHSAQSLGTLIHHPEMHEPGLNSSIVETVSTWFSDGTVSKSFVIGEIALAYNPSRSVADNETIRLDNFQMLEKIAPNPNFVTSTSSEKGKEKAACEEKAGEYSVALSAIKRPTPVVAFKYQLHLSPSNLSTYSPVLLTPAWQIQDAQASVIVMYRLNPAFILSTTEASTTTATSIRLKNVVVSVALEASADAGKATSAMMAPQNGAAFKRKQGLVVWKLPELVVSNEQQKLLVRFVTSGPKAKPGHIEAKWELVGSTGSKLGVSVQGGAGKPKEATDPFADDGTTPSTPAMVWNEVNTARSLISGRYSAA
jgi:F-BAR domain only protein